MVKTISMEIAEYEKDLMTRQEAGLCDALNQVKLFLIAKKTPSEFFGVESLDPRFLKCKLMLDILGELGIDPVEIQKVTKNIVPADPIEASPTADTAQSACASPEACNDAPISDASTTQ